MPASAPKEVAMMARPADQFKADFEHLRERVEEGCQQMLKHETIQGQTRQMIEEGALAIGQRVEILKKAGHAGNSVRDFVFDHEVTETYKAVGHLLQELQHEFARITELISGQFRKTASDYEDFMKRLNAEVARPKSADAKSLGEFRDRCQTFLQDQFEFFAFIRNGADKVSLEKYWKKVDDQVKRTSVSRESMLNRQKLDTRNLSQAFAQAQKLKSSILQELEEAKNARAKHDLSHANTAAKTAASNKEKLNKIVNEYEKAYNEYKGQLAQDKDGPAIAHKVIEMISWKRDIEKLFRLSAP
jgi:hypothetical protein